MKKLISYSDFVGLLVCVLPMPSLPIRKTDLHRCLVSLLNYSTIFGISLVNIDILYRGVWYKVALSILV